MSEESLRTYIACIDSKMPLLQKQFEVVAVRRGEAVNKAMQIFWSWKQHKEEFAGIGNVHDVMTVTDPYGEVHYDAETFHCADKLNRLLPADVASQLIKESNEELQLDPRLQGAVKRAKRRRRQGFGKFIAPNIKQLDDKTLWYRMVVIPQKSENRVIIQKRKYKDIPLDAKDLAGALREIRALELDQTANAKMAIFRSSRQIRGHAEAARVRMQKLPRKPRFTDARKQKENPVLESNHLIRPALKIGRLTAEEKRLALEQLKKLMQRK